MKTAFAGKIGVEFPDTATGSYSVKFAWTDEPTGDLWVDISEDRNFPAGSFCNKHVGNAHFTSAPDGFSNNLQLLPGKTYFWRIWDGSKHTIGAPWTVPDPNAPQHISDAGLQGRGTSTVAAGTTSSWETCAQAALRHWPPAEATIMLAIAAAESGQFTNFHGDSTALVPGSEPRSCHGLISHGAWQVNCAIHFKRLIDRTGSQDPCVWAKWLEDPNNCADVAFGVYSETKGFRPDGKLAWSTFSEQPPAYLAHMAKAQQVIAQVQQQH